MTHGRRRPRLELARIARATAAGVALLALLRGAPARAQSAREDFFVTNGTVNAELLVDGKLYVGGSFTSVGPVTGSGVPVDSSTGLARPGFPRVNGQVFVAVSDGGGGWYLGGTFTAVDGVARSNAAYVRADNSVAPWNPAPNSTVRAIALRDGSVYLGGQFSSAGGQSRNRIAEVDTALGVATSWNPNSNNIVRALAWHGSDLLVAGQFTSIGGQLRNRIAAISRTTGLATGWNPNANSNVFALEVAGDTVYAGGQFTSIGGQARNRLAALHATTALATSWNPNANNQVLALAYAAGVVYAGGQFTAAGGQTRNRVVALDAATGLATSWNPNANNQVQSLGISDGRLYVGGDFLTIGGQPRSRVAALSLASGLATNWDPTAFGSVSAIGVDGAEVFVGGLFTAVGGWRRNNLAALDVQSGQLTAWDPNANSQVLALATRGGLVYVGGQFTQIGGLGRANLAAVDTASGAPSGWNPGCDGQVTALAVTDTSVYVGGMFATVAGASRANLAEVHAGTALATPWDPAADDQVFAIVPDASGVYVGGNFSNVGGAARDFIARLDRESGLALPWNPDANGTVRSIAATCDRIYVGGFFSTIGGQSRNRIAELDPATGLATAWNPNANGPVFTVLPASGVVYVGGVLSAIGGQSRNRLAAIDPQTGLATTWNPNSDGTVRALAANPGWVFAGGSFTTIGTTASGNVASIESDASNPCPVIALPAPPLAPALLSAATSRSFAASGGSAPYCYALASGALPAGLALSSTTGLVSGTPLAAGVSVFTIVATDARGCRGEQSYTFTVLATPPVSSVAADGRGLCINPGQPCIGVPVVYTRADTAAVRSISVTIQLEASKLSLCTPGAPALSVHAGSWLAGHTNGLLEVTDNGGGSYTIDQALLGAPCGITGGGTLFVLDLKAVGPEGAGAITVTSVEARDCSNAPVAVAAGTAGSVNLLGTAITVLPVSLPGAVAGVAFADTFTATAGTPPLGFAVASGALPPGLALTSAGLLSGTPLHSGNYAFTVSATDTGGCRGTRAYTLAVACSAFVITPSLLPDGIAGVAYAETLAAPGSLAPAPFAVTAGSLPSGLSLTSAGVLSGTPLSTGTFAFTIGVTDTAGCSASESYVVDVFASAPVSSIAANTTGLAVSSAHPYPAVPFVFTRGEATPARGVTVRFRIDPAWLALRTPSNPAASVQPGPWVAGYPNAQLLVTDVGGGEYAVDLVLLGSPCGITAGGTLFTVELGAVAGDGSSPIEVTWAKARDCDNVAIPVAAGPPASLRIQNAPVVITPASLPGATTATPYSQALAAAPGEAPFAYSIGAGALPPGFTLSSGGVISGFCYAAGNYAFTVNVADAGGVPGARAYTLAVACPAMAVTPDALPLGVVGVAYAETLVSSAGAAPFAWSVTAGSLPTGLTLGAANGVLSGTPPATSVGVFTVTVTDTAGCTASESFTLPVFATPPVSMVAANTTGLCLSNAQPCASVPVVFTRGESDPARGVSVTIALDTTRLALCAPATPESNFHAGNWLAGFPNSQLHVTPRGGGRYTVDAAIVGVPCGVTTGGTLFTMDLATTGVDGAAAIAVTAVGLRDCGGAPLPAIPGPAAAITVNNAPPAAIHDLVATAIANGNGAGPTRGISLTWSSGDPGTVRLYRAPFGSYPLYDALGPVTPPDSAAAPGAPWSLIATGAAPGYVDATAPRGFWHYVAIVTNACGIASAPSNRTPGTLNYLLGDVSNGLVRGTGNNADFTEDLSLLGENYGIGASDITTRGVAYLDVGPTAGGALDGRPLPDRLIDFEDLFVFAGNFGAVVQAPQFAAREAAAAGASAAPEAFSLSAPALVEAGETVTATLALEAHGRVQAFSARLGWNPAVVEPVETRSSGRIEAQGGVTLSPARGALDAALLGLRARGIEGTGPVATFTFRARRTGDPGFRIERLVARDASNRPVALDDLRGDAVLTRPVRTLLLAPSSNPLRGGGELSFALASDADVELALFGVDGRRVRTLVHERRIAGVHHERWDGKDDSGRAAPSGVYYLRFAAAHVVETRTLVVLR